MTDILQFEEHGIQPFKHLGLTHPFFTVNKTIITHTWLLMGLLFGILLIARFFIKKRTSTIGFLARSVVESFMTMVEQNLGYFSYAHCLFITTLFLFIFTCNLGALIPYVEEPARDINTTLALGIISFLYVQINAIRVHGILPYIKDFFTPFFIMFPINIVGELATIISISFRLFGNIYGGWIIGSIYQAAVSGSVWTELLGIISGINFIVILFFGLFEGLIQAFVFSMLSLTYLSIATAPEES